MQREKKTFHLVFMAVESIKEKNNIHTDTHTQKDLIKQLRYHIIANRQFRKKEKIKCRKHI